MAQAEAPLREHVMKHIQPMTIGKASSIEDFWNAMWRAFRDFVISKMNEIYN